jgi:LysR family glycine cleavage system transcriptional activator
MARLRFKIPPPNHLVTFEAAGRRLNFTKAAEELNVSRVSVSQQIKALEDRLGVKLFLRKHKTLKLTTVGERYFHVVSDALNDILEGTVEIENGRPSNRLTVTTTSGFSAYWLLPRIGLFRESHPNIEIRLLVSDQNIDFSDEDVDLGVRYGNGDWPDLDCTLLFQEKIFPVCSPAYLKHRRTPETTQDILGESLINLDGPYDLQTGWLNWFEANGLKLDRLSYALSVNTYTNLVQAALDGQGIALLGPPLIEQYFANNSLIKIMVSKSVARRSFYIVTPKQVKKSAEIEQFIDWLQQEASHSEVFVISAPLHAE